MLLKVAYANRRIYFNMLWVFFSCSNTLCKRKDYIALVQDLLNVFCYAVSPEAFLPMLLSCSLEIFFIASTAYYLI